MREWEAAGALNKVKVCHNDKFVTVFDGIRVNEGEGLDCPVCRGIVTEIERTQAQNYFPMSGTQNKPIITNED